MEGDSRQSPHWKLEGGPAPLLLIFLLLPLSMASNYSETCAPGLYTPGYTYPRGDIVLEAGSSLEIFCVLNQGLGDAIGQNSSHLVFYRNEKLVSKEFLNIVNSSTLRLYVKEMPESDDMYYCKLKRDNHSDRSVCLNKVVVGYKPQDVQNFTCTSHNWQSLTCSWVPPKNYVKTTYTLVYNLPGRAGGRIQHGCPEKLDVRENKCFWNSSTKPQYRQPYDYYFFTVIGSNALGSIPFDIIKFHHYAHVIPAEPANLTILNKTTSSILLRWEVPYPLQVFPPGLVQKVEYQHQWEKRTVWEVANTSFLNIQDDFHVFNLTDLQYAYTLYDIRVYMRSASAIRDDMWSKPAFLTIKTNPCVPGAAPKTDIGSFEVAGGLPNRDVYIYWQQIPEYLHNGKNFEYKIIEVRENGTLRNLARDDSSKAYAKFKGLSFNSYTFTIVSANKEGHSEESSVIYIPSRLDSPGEPLSFTKIAFGGGIYELSWKHPNDHSKIVNYTIFWCSNDRDRPYQCTGYLNWTHVSRDIQIINITVPEDKIFQFAISANTETASSGMVWASCTVIHNKAVGKMKSVWINRSGSTFIEVGWKLECSDRIGLVQGYRIYYCPIMSPYNLTCKAPEQNRTFDAGKIHGRITNLKPYTTYMVAVSVLTKSGEGLQSDPLYNNTFEGAPATPPTNLTITDVTNSTMKISWLPPEQMNGVLRYVEVFYNDNSVKVEDNKSSVVLENLKSFTNYSVSVAACTVSCSANSSPVIVRTDVGIPGMMERPVVKVINSSLVMVSWRPPVYPAGKTSYFELKVGESDGKTPEEEKYLTSEDHKMFVPIPDCEIKSISKFAVRAVNVGPGNAFFRGNWSEVGEANCFNSGDTRELQFWVPVGVAILVALIVIVYLSKRAWARCKEMQDVEVKLPAGLVPYPPKEKDPEMFGWPAQPFSADDRVHIAPKKSGLIGAPDEVVRSLLDQKERHGRNPSGDSSGCGSATDSVSSAITSGTQISSDSGADMERCAPSPDIVFRSTNESTLRFRNVPPPAENYSPQSLPSDMTDMDIGSRSTGGVLIGQGKESPVESWDYSRFGVTESSGSPQPGGYVSLASVTTPGIAGADSDNHCLDGVSSATNSNYVAHPNMWLQKEASLLIPMCSEGDDTAEEEGCAFVPPGSYCRMGWRPETEQSSGESEAVVPEFPERPSSSEAEGDVLVRSPASEGYVTVASLGAGIMAGPVTPESARCHSAGILPDQDCGLDDEEVLECSTEPASPQGHATSPGYVALRYFAKDEGIRNSRHDVVDQHGGASPGGTTNHSLTNEES